MSMRVRESTTRPDCGDLELRFALEIPDMVRCQHRLKVEEVRFSHPHTVSWIDEQPGDGLCLPYALDLLGDPAYTSIVNGVIGLPGTFVGTDFANWLLDGRLTSSEPCAGALVLYFKKDIWAHAGKLVEHGRVRSKWGQFPVYEHATWEVPCRYGDEVRYFEMPPRSIFEEYADSSDIAQWHLHCE
jgi:hypothetical protein